MVKEEEPDRELYALLHLSPDASDEDIRRAYRQWAQVYHPDKHQSLQMQGIATENFQRIREAYEILSDASKRQIYDIYGMEGVKSGLELGPRLNMDDIVKEVEKARQRQRQQRVSDRVHHSSTMVVDVSLEEMLKSFPSRPTIRGMTSASEVQAQISRKDSLVLGGNVAFRGGVGGGELSAMFRHHISSETSVEAAATVGLRSLLSLHTSRQLSSNATGTLGVSFSLVDGSMNVINIWTRQLSEAARGNIQLVVGPDTAVSVGWHRQDQLNSCSGEIKLGQSGFGINGQYVRAFSQSSYGRISGKIGGASIDVEIGGQRKISERSAVGMYCLLGTQGISWKFRFLRGGQKFTIPIFLTPILTPMTAIGAMLIPSSLYAFLKVYIVKPYLIRKNEQRKSKQRQSTAAQVHESKAKAEKAQSLLKNVAERKRSKQATVGGLVVLQAVYGNLEESGQLRMNKPMEGSSLHEYDFLQPFVDVTTTLNFLVDDGRLLLHGGVKKSGLIGFCDPCPGEPKHLKVIYTYRNNKYEVVVGDLDELCAPQESHRIAA